MSTYTSSQYDDGDHGVYDPYLAQARTRARRVDQAHRISYEAGFVMGGLSALAVVAVGLLLVWWAA